MEMKTRLLFVPLLLALVASLAACGGGGQSVPANAIAEVDGTPITVAEFNNIFTQAQAMTVAQHQPKPTPGSQAYTTLRNQVVAALVQWTEVKQQAKKEDVSVSKSEIDKSLTDLAKSRFHGSMKKLVASYKQQGMSMDLVRELLLINQLSTKIRTKVTASAKVTEAQERSYYNTNIAQYNTPAQTTRSVQYILFKCAAQGATICSASKSRAEKKLADKVEQKLRNGASFSAMAKQYSDDPTTAPQGGKYTLVKDSVVPAFGAAGFALKTGETSQPVNATSTSNQGYGWFIIKALGPVKKTPAHTTPFSQAKATIKQALLQQAQEKLWEQWVSDLQASYQGKVKYQGSYAPPTTTTLPTTNGTPTTG
jgi:parvulin-like peptidyl-prolyl isomerase